MDAHIISGCGLSNSVSLDNGTVEDLSRRMLNTQVKFIRLCLYIALVYVVCGYLV